jgi:glutamate-ammonia-ligase adenylyltransferase
MEVPPGNKISQAVDALPVELRSIASLWFERLLEDHDCRELGDEMLAPLAKLVACSDFAAKILLREWQWFVAEQASLHTPPDAKSLERFARQVSKSDASIDSTKEQLRRYRHRYMLHVLWREVAGTATLGETLLSLSTLADRLLEAATGFGERQLHERYGIVRDERGDPVSIVVLGMGKLGGTELNFSSDIDLIFLYPSGQDSDGGRNLSPQEYFTRLSRHIIALLDEVTADGFVFRIDTRLRPFGDSGPPVVSFAALESYLLQHGRGWERYAYVKARIVGLRPATAVAEELQENLISPFVYRRYLDFGVFESLRDMQALIAAEVKRRELADNIKSGPGGIREIEFIVQSLQLVRGGRQPELQDRELLSVLPKLIGRHGMNDADASGLEAAYRFLRRLENFIQAIRDQQTHELPANETDRARLCLAMGYPDWGALLEHLDRHRRNVTQQFEAIAYHDHGGDADNRLQQQLATLWAGSADPAAWTRLLADEGFAQAEDIARRLALFSTAPGTQQIDSIARRRLQHFVPKLLLLIKQSEQPLTTLRRILTVVEKILRRSAYLALLNENSHVMERLVSLCGRSAYIAEQIARYPVLLDELLDPRVQTERVPKGELDAELEQRLAASSTDDSESQMAILADFQRASMFRVAVADFTGNLPIMKVSDNLTDLAETVLNHALRVAWQDLTEKHGVPGYIVDGKRRQAGFGIIAYGKLGGIELSYGSDLDLVFLHDAQGDQQQTDGKKPLDNAMFFIRLVRRLAHFLTTQTGSGMLYDVDMRLRPDGQSGLLVSSVEAFERYQEENAWTWEHQALLRARPVAGSANIAREFERIRADTLSAPIGKDKLREDVASMRTRMREKLDKSDEEFVDLKQGIGGIGDIEFLVQYLVLANAREHPEVFRYSDNIRQLDALAATGCIENETSLRLQDIYKAYRLRTHHLTLDDRQALVPRSEFEAEHEYVERLWEQTFGAAGA